ncbi:RNA-binding S4 domain-containing protein [Paracoccus sp. (in: a-proteobacteria)]|uniref:RNA-binding S4 domain-containing protein n=1 Tax=Paracoccus sp. TaxID=267 RepID=UPI0028A168FE|nr:RNA-binding S4 domain-containing protein [Paracoccus sp. (in: a-proteobacteria)]
MRDDKIRLDRWLFHVRVFKTRTLASDRIQSGGVRVNGEPCRKPSRLIGAGDQVTVATSGRVYAYQVVAAGERRGPASEAQTLYLDLTAGITPEALD